jgi:hypothetical protein
MPNANSIQRPAYGLLTRSLATLLCGTVALVSACTETPTTPGGLQAPDEILATASGNSANAHSCQKGGWQSLFTSTGSPFASQGACVSYGAQGGVYSGPQTIAFTSSNPSPVKVGAPTYTPTATASSGLPVSITLDGTSSGCVLTSGVVSFPSAGTCLINANQPGGAGWLAAAQVQQSITISAPVYSTGCTWLNAGEWNHAMSGPAAVSTLSTLTFAAGETINISILVSSSNTGGGSFHLRITTLNHYDVSSGFGPVNNTFTGQYTVTGLGDLILYAVMAAGNGSGVVSNTSTVTCTPAP